MKKNNNKGFTLMEMLIVVAIIGILIAIAIPTFSGQLQKAKLAADQANVRAAYAEAMSDAILNDGTGSATMSATTQTAGSMTIGSVTASWGSNQTGKWTVTAGVPSFSAS